MFTRFTCFDIGTVCIIMYCQDRAFQEVKGLTEKLYAYALARMKTRFQTATDIELRFFMKKKKRKKQKQKQMKMKNL